MHHCILSISFIILSACCITLGWICVQFRRHAGLCFYAVCFLCLACRVFFPALKATRCQCNWANRFPDGRWQGRWGLHHWAQAQFVYFREGGGSISGSKHAFLLALRGFTQGCISAGTAGVNIMGDTMLSKLVAVPPVSWSFLLALKVCACCY